MIRLKLGRTKLNGIRRIITSKELNRSDGNPTEFEWKIFPGFTTLCLLGEIQKLMKDLQYFAETGHPVFRASSAFERGESRSKGHGKKSIHFNGSEENIELLLRTKISANQLSVHGAVADLCKELSEDSERSVKLEASDHLETMEIPVGLHTNAQQHGNLVQDYERRFEQLSDDQKLSKLCSDAGLRIVERGQYFLTLDTEEGANEMGYLCQAFSMPRCEKKTRA